MNEYYKPTLPEIAAAIGVAAVVFISVAYILGWI